MSGLLIYKASAGSGKTFQLTRQYLEILFREEKNYSAILAVTFTNKAAGELKDRVISELVSISRGEVENSAHFDYLSDVLNRGKDVLVPRANRILRAILKDYSHFSIGTIDEFFQSILRSFAKDVGISTGYQVELSSRNIILEAIQRLIDRAADDNELFKWILDGIGDKIAEGKAWRGFEKELFDLGNELIKEQLSALLVDSEQDTFSKDKIIEFRKELKSKVKSFKMQMAEISSLTLELLERHGLSVDDFARKTTGPVGFLQNLKNESYDPQKKIAYIDDPGKWVTKTCPADIRPIAMQLVNNSLNDYLKEAANLFDNEYPLVQLSEQLLKQLSRLGLMSSLTNEIIQLSKEKELFLISFTNPIIAKLIQDNPAPFIYERTGRYFKHYMIDEFQDTSDMQWSNFVPLVKESLSSGGRSMLVGDAKQSIYRWRNSNWRLIESKAEADLAEFSIEPRALNKNFRSRESIVDFINQLFSKAGNYICQQLEEEVAGGSENASSQINSIRHLYDNVIQDFGKRVQGGYIKLSFLEKEIVDDFPAHFGDILKLVEHLQLNKKYKPNDIVFLVRKNKEASEIIRYFIAYKDSSLAKEHCVYNAVSAESLRLDSSAVIRTILAFFNLEKNHGSHSFLARFTMELLACKTDLIEPEVIEVIGSKDRDRILQLNQIEDFEGLIDKSRELNYFEKIEFVINTLKLNTVAGSYPFILSFKEHLYDEFRNTANLDLDIINEWWEDSGKLLMVPMNEKVNAMRVMSVHKAKGLEFPVVIMPNCNWELDHESTKSPVMWLDTKDTPFATLPFIPVKYQKLLKKTPFAEKYYDERIQTSLDNLNLLYVALTRAVDQLHLYIPKIKRSSAQTSGSLLESIAQPDDTGIYEFGDHDTFNETISSLPDNIIQASVYPANFDFRQSPNEVFSSKELVRGKLLHAILEKIVSIDDIEKLLNDMDTVESLDMKEASEISEKLKRLFSREDLLPFYSKEAVVYNEKSFLLPGKSEFRADRVVFIDDRVIVIEYKTGQIQAQHKSQVKRYMQGLKHMGHLKVEGYLIYFDTEEVVSV